MRYQKVNVKGYRVEFAKPYIMKNKKIDANGHINLIKF